MDKFSQAFAELIGNEGGFKKQYSDHMDWSGGKVGVGELRGTKYGISAGSYPDLDIENLTLDQAKAIYKRDFWDKFHGDDLRFDVGFQIFDADVNHGIGNGARMMQRALGVADDGRVGPITLGVLEKADPQGFDMKFLAERLEFFTKCSTWDENGKGWTNRVLHNLALVVAAYPDNEKTTHIILTSQELKEYMGRPTWTLLGKDWAKSAANQLRTWA